MEEKKEAKKKEAKKHKQFTPAEDAEIVAGLQSHGFKYSVIVAGR
jgi:hypothetical protein